MLCQPPPVEFPSMSPPSSHQPSNCISQSSSLSFSYFGFNPLYLKPLSVYLPCFWLCPWLSYFLSFSDSSYHLHLFNFCLLLIVYNSLLTFAFRISLLLLLFLCRRKNEWVKHFPDLSHPFPDFLILCFYDRLLSQFSVHINPPQFFV